MLYMIWVVATMVFNFHLCKKPNFDCYIVFRLDALTTELTTLKDRCSELYP